MLTPGLVSNVFRKLTVPEVIHLARKSALKSIEWEGDVHIPCGREDAALDARKRTEDAGLTIAGFSSCYCIGASEKEQPAFESVLETAIGLKAPTIRIRAGTASPGKTGAASRKSIIRKTQKIAALAAEAGITISLAFRRNTLVENSDSALQLLNEIEHPHVLSTWQPPTPVGRTGTAAGLRELLPRVGNLYASYSKSAAAERFGAGEELWQRIFKLLRQSGRDHHILIARLRDESPENFLEDAAALRGWLADEE